MDSINRDIKILVVDDSATMRRIVKNFLNRNGFLNLVEARDGAKALETVKNDRIELLVCDLNMPKMNGMELLKILKEDARTQAIPFVMLTVEAIQTTMIKAVQLKVDSYIVKPVAEKVFMQEIYRVLNGAGDPYTVQDIKF